MSPPIVRHRTPRASGPRLPPAPGHIFEAGQLLGSDRAACVQAVCGDADLASEAEKIGDDARATRTAAGAIAAEAEKIGDDVRAAITALAS